METKGTDSGGLVFKEGYGDRPGDFFSGGADLRAGIIDSEPEG